MNRQKIIIATKLNCNEMGTHNFMVLRGGIMTVFDKVRELLNPKGKKTGNREPVKINSSLEEKKKKVAQLTPREYELFLLLIEGYTLKESAKQLSIKYSTANTHMSAIYRKLEVNTRAELIINYRNINDIEK